MKLIVGLGNPGAKYQNNRHNVGQLFVDYLINQLTDSRINKLKHDKHSNSQFVNTLINNEKIVLVKLLTFMNLSGPAVRKIIKNLKLKIKNLIVVHDDLDIPLGKFKIQKGVGPKLHNGIESIEKALQTKDFWRVRIGVDNRQKTGYVDGETYVLQNFRSDEKKIISDLFPKIYQRLKESLLNQHA